MKPDSEIPLIEYWDKKSGVHEQYVWLSDYVKLQLQLEKLVKFVEKISETRGGSWIECYAPEEAQELLNELTSSR